MQASSSEILPHLPKTILDVRFLANKINFFDHNLVPFRCCDIYFNLNMRGG